MPYQNVITWAKILINAIFDLKTYSKTFRSFLNIFKNFKKVKISQILKNFQIFKFSKFCQAFLKIVQISKVFWAFFTPSDHVLKRFQVLGSRFLSVLPTREARFFR